MAIGFMHTITFGLTPLAEQHTSSMLGLLHTLSLLLKFRISAVSTSVHSVRAQQI
jgi:hypothetical protein